MIAALITWVTRAVQLAEDHIWLYKSSSVYISKIGKRMKITLLKIIHNNDKWRCIYLLVVTLISPHAPGSTVVT